MTKSRRTTAQMPPRPFWLPDGCPNWCEDTKDHSPGDLREDRVHVGTEARVPLTRHDPVDYPGGTWEPEYWTTYLRQHPEAAEPSVFLGLGEDCGTEMTFDEAEQLAERLLEHVLIGGLPENSRSRARAALEAMRRRGLAARS